jgi:hypothetical protein
MVRRQADCLDAMTATVLVEHPVDMKGLMMVASLVK